jgi:tetratricopeptide (TPR) repeat protein
MKAALPPAQLAEMGLKAFHEKDFLRAEEAFSQAAEAYTLSGDELSAAEMANNRSVALLQAGRLDEALQAASGTAEIFSQANDRLRQAKALGNQAAALDALHRFVEAADYYKQSADLLKDLGELDLRAAVMQSLSTLQLRQGRHLEALATMDAGLDGIKHPNLRQRMVKKLLQAPFKLLTRS